MSVSNNVPLHPMFNRPPPGFSYSSARGYMSHQNSAYETPVGAVQHSAPENPSNEHSLENNLFLNATGRGDVYISGIKALLKRTGYKFQYKGGQSIYFDPPNWIGYPPTKGSEVFVCISRQIYEYDLEPLFSRFGQIYEMRLMLDFSGTNRGFAYVRYASPEVARAAIEGLNHHRGQGIIEYANISYDNSRLFVNGLPMQMTRDELLDYFSYRTEDLCSVTICRSKTYETPNRGFCFLQYANHVSAANARRALLHREHEPHSEEWTICMSVEWAIPYKLSSPSCDKCKKLLVYGMPRGRDIMSFLDQHMDTSFLIRCEWRNRKVLLEFSTHDEAYYALHLLAGVKVKNKYLRIRWMNPVSKVSNSHDFGPESCELNWSFQQSCQQEHNRETSGSHLAEVDRRADNNMDHLYHNTVPTCSNLQLQGPVCFNPLGEDNTYAVYPPQVQYNSAWFTQPMGPLSLPYAPAFVYSSALPPTMIMIPCNIPPSTLPPLPVVPTYTSSAVNYSTVRSSVSNHYYTS